MLPHVTGAASLGLHDQADEFYHHWGGVGGGGGGESCLPMDCVTLTADNSES